MNGKKARAIRKRYGVRHVRLAKRNPYHTEQPYNVLKGEQEKIDAAAALSALRKLTVEK